MSRRISPSVGARGTDRDQYSALALSKAPEIPPTRKGCPKGAFLGICEEGLVQGIRPGQYTRSKDNKRYAVEAIKALKETPSLTGDPDALWRAVPDHPLNENGQMDVVISLWERGLII